MDHASRTKTFVGSTMIPSIPRLNHAMITCFKVRRKFQQGKGLKQSTMRMWARYMVLGSVNAAIAQRRIDDAAGVPHLLLFINLYQSEDENILIFASD
jgi:hypothetical protein